FRRFMSARLAATLLELPAIHLFHALTSNCMSPVGGTIFQNLSRHRPPSASIRRYDLSKQVTVSIHRMPLLMLFNPQQGVIIAIGPELGCVVHARLPAAFDNI